MMVMGFYPNPNDLFLLEDALSMFFFYSNIKVTNTLFLHHFQNRKIEITFFILSVYLELRMDINNKKGEKILRFMEAKQHSTEPTLGKEFIKKK